MSEPKHVKLMRAEAKADLMQWFGKRIASIDNGIIAKAIVPANLTERHEMSKRCANLHSKRNPSDPFAWNRAYASVFNGWMNEQDFKSGNISLGC